ncbi:sterol desaturase family protein [Antrihabitans stalactiti]|uniref:Sterol desaturase family protein n=1 Tax=Antrihabitans stalactiti TaxID=2584121 RepID=A0A848KIH7_9NOCA|nr:sterol desaturase family protein [Antrihabitans stalactiti]NMN97596.1 sterol desaturase family protein [Antrihabitans stalactiti]
MFDLILHAIPVFIICLALEAISFRFLPDDDEKGYELRDAATSVSMGLGEVFINIGWKLAVLAIYAAAYTVAPFQLPADNPFVWVALFFADDFVYYWYHRLHHTVRVLWGSHVVHHSSQFYNLSTAVRQTWTPMTALPFWLPLAFLGFSPWMILFQQSISLVYQFFLHTERIDKLPRPIEFVLNTPSHHRVHHGSNSEYLDKNYGGILIVWDRLFRSFEPEGARVRYGLTKNINTHNPFVVAFGEYHAIWRDVRTAGNWRARFGYVFRGPGWSPSPSPASSSASSV